tara:strand:- start:511 stop:711 length:201 start_codon:yes stop_codon:yes gene_type:complete
MDCNCTNKDKCMGTKHLVNCKKLNETAETAETAEHNGFDAWINVLEEEEQPTCDIENQEDCENCGS